MTRCGGITNLLRLDGLCKARNLPFSAHCAPAISAHACCAMESVVHIEYFYDHHRIERMLFDGTLDPCGGLLTPGPGPPRARDRAQARRSRPLRRLTAEETVHERHRGTSCAGPRRPAVRGRHGATAMIDVRGLRRRSRRQSRGRCASTPSQRRCMPPTPPTTARSRSGSSIPKTLDDVVATHRHLSRVRRPDRRSRRRDEPVRGDGQLRGGHRPLQVPHRDRRCRRRDARR